MTAQSSTTKRPGFLTYFLYRLGKLKFLTAILVLLEFFTYPFYMIMLDRYTAMAMDAEHADENMLETMRVLVHSFNWYIFAAAVLGAAIVSLIIMLSAFRYLHFKKYVNMDLSLPVTHRQRFFGDMLASFTSIFVPHLLSALTGLAMIAKIRSIDGYEQFINDSNYHSSSSELGLYVAEHILPYFIIVYLMLYFMTLFIISTTGKRVTAIMLPIVMQIAIPMAILFINVIAQSTTYGTESLYGVRFGDVGPVAILSPVTFMLQYMGYSGIENQPWVLIVLAVYLAALCIGSYFIQKHRRAERTGEAFVLRYARHTYTAICVLAVTSYFWWAILCPLAAQGTYLFMKSGYETPVIFHISAWLFLSLVVFVVAELVGGGKLKKLPFTVIRFVATTAGCAALCTAVSLTDGFGAGSYIPPADEVKNVYVHFNYGYDYFNTNDLPYDEITEFHKKIISERPLKSNNISDKYTDLMIQYIGENGTVCSRRYALTGEYIRELYELIFRNGGLASTNNYGTVPNSSRSVWEVDVKTGKQTEIIEYPTDTYVNVQNDFDENGGMIKYRLPADDLIAAIRADASDVTFEQMYLSAYAAPEDIIINYIYPGKNDESFNSYKIYPFFKRTLTLLENYGVKMFRTQQYHDAFIIKVTEPRWRVEVGNSISISDIAYNSELRRIAVGSAEYDSALAMSAERSFYSESGERYILMLVSENAYITGDTTSGYKYLTIPEQYTEAAAMIYNNAQTDETAHENLAASGSIF